MKARPRILLGHRYYWPDTAPYGRLLKPLATSLAAEGFDVTVFATLPHYGSARPRTRLATCTLEGRVRVIRSRWIGPRGRTGLRRMLADGAFVLSLCVHLLAGRRYDLVMFSTSPPVIGALAVRLVSKLRDSAMIYHCQDLHPESAIAGGLLRRGWLSNVLQRLDRWTCRRADRVVVLSTDMRDGLAMRGCSDGRVSILNNAIVPAPELGADGDVQLEFRPDDFVVLFAGNLGRFQGLESVIRAAELLGERERIRFVLAGEGPLLPDLRAGLTEAGRRTIMLPGFLQQPSLDRLMARADVALVPLKSGMHRYGYPSKTQSYLSAGCRLLVVVDEPSELASLVRRERLGRVCPPERPELLAETVLELSRGPPVAAEDRARARSAAQQFSESVVLPQWSTLIRAVLAGNETQ